MEDFGSILWILVIVGAMIFNVASQSKKAREKRAAQAPRHDEAWPSETLPPVRPAEAYGSEHPAPQPVTPAFPDECQGLEEIPGEEYVPAFTTQKAANTGRVRHQTVSRLKNGSDAEETAAFAIAGDTPEEHPASIAEEFDLQRAVIYSEILKPKFEE